MASTEVIVEINNIARGLSPVEPDNLEIYFSSGAPNGFSTLYDQGLTFLPSFLGLEIDQGSEGGATFNAIVSGVGYNDSI